jgi:amino acid adenylation domain-containing protein
MTAAELINVLADNKVSVSVERDELVIRASGTSLTADLIGNLKEHKAELIDLLRKQGGYPAVAQEPSATQPLTSVSSESLALIAPSVPHGAENVQDVYPLAPLQEGILFHYLLGTVGDPYVVSTLLEFDKRETLDRYLVALQSVVDRHDILRTAILWDGLPEPMQVVWRRATLPIEEIPLDPSLGDACDQLWRRFNPGSFRMDVRQAPLLRIYLAHDRQNHRWLMMRMLHHLAGDQATVDAIHIEVQACLLGQERQLPPPIPFRRLVVEARHGISEQEHERYFRHMLGDVDEPTSPFGMLDVTGEGKDIEEAHLVLDHALCARLRACARHQGVSVAGLFHLAWAMVLGKITARDDVVFGTVLFGRMQSGGSGSALGLFINTLPLRIILDARSVAAMAKQTHLALSELMVHEHASLALAQRCSAVVAPTPLFTSLLNYRHRAIQSTSEEDMKPLPGVRALGRKDRTNYPLAVSIDDDGIWCSITVQTLPAAGAARVCEFMRTAVESMVSALEITPDKPACNLNVLPAKERDLVLNAWNATEAWFPADKCAHQLFEEQAARDPKAVALVFAGKTLCYGELNRAANRLARHLRSVGVGPDKLVAICAHRGFEMIIAVLAVLKAGGAYVPLDPSYPAERLRFMLKDSSPAALLIQKSLLGLFSGISESAILELDAELSPWLNLADSNIGPPVSGLAPSHSAYVIYTSGSTGTPKGVIVEHRALCNLVVAQMANLAITPNSRFLQFFSFSFDPWIEDVMVTLCSGAALYLIRQEQAASPEALSRFISQNQITHTVLPPAVAATLRNEAESELTSLRVMMIGGDVLTQAMVKQFAPGRRLLNGYGPTETTVCATTYHCDPNHPGNPPIGRPIANTRTYILDKHGLPAPIGVPGELYIAGIGVARGYLHRPDLTAERFVPDPFVADRTARMYRTGDLARWRSDGAIEFLGRNDFQVKIRGFRVELGEIETRLSEIPGIRDAVVVAREDAPGEKRLVAYYSCSPAASAALHAEQLRDYLSACLPHYMVPASYVRLDSLPLTPNGKVDRKALPAITPDGPAAHEPPRGQLEQDLAKLWAGVLNVATVGRHDNFFELGGHSLRATQLMSRVRQAMGVEVPLRRLFEGPTVAHLAAYIQAVHLASQPGECELGAELEGGEL